MEITEFVIFLSIQIILLVLTLMRRGALFGLIGLLTTVFVIPFVLNGVVVSRFYMANSTGALEPEIIYADKTFILLIMFLVSIAHIISIFRSVRE